MVRYNRMFAMVLAFVMVFTLAVVPARSVGAESASSNSLEVNIDAEGTVFNGKLYFDMVNEAFAITGSMGYNGQTLMDAALYLGSAGLAVSGAPFLDQAYGIDLQNLTKNLPNSVFAPDSGSQLALDQETYDMLMSGPDALVNSQIAPFSEVMELLENGMSVLMPHWEAYTNSLKRNVQITAGPKTLNLPTGDVKTTTSTVSVTGEVVAEAATCLIDSLAGDAEAQAFLAQFYDLMVSSAIITPDENLQGVSGKDLFDTIFQNKEEFCQELTQAFIETNMTIACSAAIDQQTEELVSFGLEMTADGETVSLELVFANGTYYLDVADNGVHSKIVFCIQKDTKDQLVATLAVTEDGVETARIAFTWNKTAGTYKVTVADDTNIGAMTGTITSDDTSTTITFDEIDGESMGNTYIKLSSSDPVTFPSYKDVLTMTEDEILQVVRKFTNLVNQLSE